MRQYLLPSIHEHKINSADQPSFKSVDYLFLLEINCVHDRSLTDEILGVIQSLLKQINDKQIYQDVSAQVGVVYILLQTKFNFFMQETSHHNSHPLVNDAHTFSLPF